MMATSQQTVKNSQDRQSEIHAIIEKLRQRDSELFARIVDAIHAQDSHTSKILAHEVSEIRKAIAIIQDVITPRYPDLILCPVCCSPEISISDSASPRCYCLECGKIWIVEMLTIKQKLIENVWSVA
jgi:hypothetical protein